MLTKFNFAAITHASSQTRRDPRTGNGGNDGGYIWVG